MPSLRDTQCAFCDAVLGGRDAAFLEQLLDAGDAARRVQVYRNNVYGNLAEALRAIYPVVDRLVGADFFRETARHYIRAHPSRSGDLNLFGGKLAEFLVRFEPVITLPYLPDVARLEWFVQEVWFAADHPPLQSGRLARVDASRYPGLRFRLHPAVRLLESAYPVHRIWEVNQEGYDGDTTVDLAEGGVRLLIRRGTAGVELKPLSPGEWALLCAWREGCSLDGALDAALAIEPDYDPHAALQRFVMARVVADFSVDSSTASGEHNA